MTRIGNSELDVFQLGIGTNIFGWTIDENQAFAVLDAYLEAGGNFVDTADEQPRFIHDGCTEVMLGNWIKSRGVRDRIVLATKGGKFPGLEGLAPATIRAAVDASLSRLQVDCIDLYYAHRDDPDTPLEESLATYDALIQEGKLRYIAACDYTAPRLAEALAISDREGLARFVVYQPTYNLMDRGYEAELRGICEREGVSCIAAWGLARGFLTGKYRADGPAPDTARGDAAFSYLDARGESVLAALDEVAAAHGVPLATVALAWVRDQPTVVGTLASARTTQQVQQLAKVADLQLSHDQMERLAAAGNPASASV